MGRLVAESEVNVMSISTKTGDCGQTSLFTGERVDKNHPRLEVLGSLDILNTMLGMARHDALNALPSRSIEFSRFFFTIQSKLFMVGSMIASTKFKNNITEEDVENLNKLVEFFEKSVKTPDGFVIVGGTPLGIASIDVCRVLTRKLERDIVSLINDLKAQIDEYKVLLKWINRLSDVLWLLARFIECESGHKSLTLKELRKSKENYGFI